MLGNLGSRYEVLDRIGGGGWGEVWKVRDRVLKQTLAMKILSGAQTSREDILRFKREFRLLSGFEHPRVVKVYDFGELPPSGLYYTMEFVPSRNVEPPRSREQERVFLILLDRICDALGYIHSQGVLHGDLKPSNILVLDCAENDAEVKLVDFGMSRTLEPSRSDELRGTLPYMAPEAFRGWRLDARSDLYSLGVCLYQMLFGRLPFDSQSPMELIRDHVEESPPPPPTPLVTEGFEEVIFTLLEKAPERRFSSASELRARVRSLLGWGEGAAIGSALPDGRGSRFFPRKFIGRHRELALVTDLVEGARRGNPVVVVVWGEQGVGKTALLKEIAVRAQLQGDRVVKGRCTRGQDTAYGTIRDVFHQLLPTYRDSLSEEDLAAVDSVLSKGEMEYTGWQAAQGASAAEIEISRNRTASALASAIGCSAPTVLAERAPGSSEGRECVLLAAMDDADQADEGTAHVIRELLRCSEGKSLVLLVSASSESGHDLGFLKPGDGESRSPGVHPQTPYAVTELVLSPLDHSQVGELVEVMLGGGITSGGAIQWIARQTGGNPLFLEVFLQHLLEDGALHRSGGGFLLSPGLQHRLEYTPPSMRDMIQSRLGRLHPQVLKVARLASILGERFRAEHLCQVTGENQDGVLDALRVLLERGILIEERSGDSWAYGFYVPQVRSVLERDLPDKERQRLHGRVAEVLEADSDIGRDVPGVLARHFRLSNQPEKAYKYFLSAGRQAHRVYSTDLALSYFQSARSCLSSGDLHPEDQAAVFGELAHIYLTVGELERALRCLRDGEAILRNCVEPSSSLVDLLTKQGTILRVLSRRDEAVAALEEAYRRAEESGDHTRLARILMERGWVRLLNGDLDGAETDLEDAVRFLGACYEPAASTRDSDRVATNPREQAVALLRLGAVASQRVDLDRAVDCYSRARSFVTPEKHKGLVAAIEHNLGVAYRSKGNLEKALSSYQSTLKVREEMADRLGLIRTQVSMGYVLALLGRWDEAEKVLQRAKESAVATRFSNGECCALLVQAVLHLERGWYHKAQELASESLALAEEIGSEDLQGMAHCYLGEIHSSLGKGEPARASFERALEYSKEAGDADGIAAAIAGYSLMLIQEERAGDAKDLLAANEAALAKGQSAPQPWLVAVARTKCAMALDDLELAGSVMESMRDLVRQGLGPLIGARTSILEAELLMKQGETREAKGLLVDAVTELRGLSCRHDVARAYRILGDIEWRAGRRRLASRYFSEARRLLIELEALKEAEEVPEVATEEARKDGAPDDSAFGAMCEISGLLNSIHDLPGLLEAVMDVAIRYLGGDRGVVLLFEEQTGTLEPKVARNMEGESLKDVVDISRTVVDEVGRSGEPWIVRDVSAEPRLKTCESIVASNIQSVLCVPLIFRGKIQGAVYVDNRTCPGVFTEEDIGFFRAFADQTALAIQNATKFTYLWGERIKLQLEVGGALTFEGFVGPGRAMQDVFEQIRIFAPQDIAVLVQGETGTGKDLAARQVHMESARKAGPFEKLDCSRISKTLIETELFGIRKGRATEVTDLVGVFERASGGTVFLDEIDNLDQDVQEKLLNVLQDREVYPLGAKSPIPVDIRVVAATSKDLEEEARRGAFRAALLFRLNAAVIKLPRLRDRKEDIPVLVDHFLRKHGAKVGKPNLKVSPEAMDLLIDHAWPGNVRELENCIHRAMILAQGKQVLPKHLPDTVVSPSRESGGDVSEESGRSLADRLADLEKRSIREALERFQWNQTKAANDLGMHESTLRKKMKKYGIRPPGEA